MIKSLPKFFVLIFIILSSWIRGIGQEPFYWQLTEEDGLPSMTIYQVHQDKKGFMWFGTENGICRYDGKEMETYYHPDLLDNEILTIQEDSWGRIWFRNLAGQIAYCENNEIIVSTFKEEGKLFEFLVIDSILHSYTRTTDESGRHLVHFKRYNISEIGLLQYAYRYNTNYTNGLRELFICKQKIYAVISDPKSVLIELNPKSNDIKEYKFHWERLFNSNFQPLGLTISEDDELSFFASERYKSTFTFDQDSLILQKEHDFEKILTDDPQQITSVKGIYHPYFSNRKNNKELFSKLNVNHSGIVSDYENNIWVGTKGNGLIIFPELEITSFSKVNSNLFANPINVIYPYEKNRILVGHINGKISIIDGDQIIQKQINDKLKKIRIISKDSFENYWFAGDGAMVQIFDKNLESSKVFHFGGVKDILFFDEKSIWTCLSNNIVHLKNVYAELNRVKKEISYGNLDIDAIFQKRVYALLKTPRVTWIGSSKGIYKYKNGESIPFLENNEHIPYSVSDIVQSKDSTVWVSTQGHGILGIKNDSVFHRIDENSGLTINNCSNLFYDDYNNLWIGSKKGLHKLDLNTYEIEVIDKYDGMPTNEISSIYVKDSIVWVGTQKGLMKIPFSAIQKNKTPPPIHITNVAFWEKDTTLFSSYDLKYNQNNINIEFVGITYRNRGNTNYQYRMLGVDTNWVSTKTRFARYPLLNPGDYEFQVKAINEDGVESISPAKIQLSIHQPWWQTWWFYLLTFASGVGLIGSFFYRRFQRIRKEEKQQQEFDEKINDLRMMALQAQMNPHFVFNALSAIQKFLTTDEQEQAMIYLARFAQLIRSIFEQSKEKIVTLDEEFEFLKLYLDLEKLRFKDKVKINFEVDKTISEDDYDLQIPPLLIQPIVENAFKHGLMHKEEGGNLKIEFSKNEEYLFCKIEDNGVGRELAREMGEGKLRRERPSGLKTAKERLAILNQSSLKIKDLNNLVIQDLMDENENPIGTRVEIKIKYNNYNE